MTHLRLVAVPQNLRFVNEKVCSFLGPYVVIANLLKDNGAILSGPVPVDDGVVS